MTTQQPQREKERSGQPTDDLHAAYNRAGKESDTLCAEQAALIRRLNNRHKNSVEVQRERMLLRLRYCAISSKEARKLGICNPAARVNELRHMHGHNIQTIWIKQPSSTGKLRSVALYQLQPGTWHADAQVK